MAGIESKRKKPKKKMRLSKLVEFRKAIRICFVFVFFFFNFIRGERLVQPHATTDGRTDARLQCLVMCCCWWPAHGKIEPHKYERLCPSAYATTITSATSIVAQLLRNLLSVQFANGTRYICFLFSQSRRTSKVGNRSSKRKCSLKKRNEKG